MPTIPEALADALRQRGIPEAVIKTIQPCIDVASSPPAEDDALAVGASKFGGAPDVPAGFEWPTSGDHPLAFLAQINLADVPHLAEHPLPDDGILSFWFDAIAEPWGFDPKQADGFQVYYFPVGISIERHEFPEFDVETLDELAVIDSFEPYNPCPMAFSLSASVDVNPLDVHDPSYDDHEDAICEIRGELMGEQGEGVHRLLGVPTQVQGEMQQECQLVSNGIYCGDEPDASLKPQIEELLENADDWRLLFQIDSDDNPDWMWGDMGCLYFWIRHQDLARRDFAKVWCVLQCA